MMERARKRTCMGDPRSLGAQDPIGLLDGSADVGAFGRRLYFGARTIIFREGDEARSIVQVIDGAVMLYKLLPDGRRQLVELIAAGGFFGCMPLRFRDCSAETLLATSCLELDRELVDRSPALARRVGAQLGSQLCALHEHVMLLGRKSALERLTSFLMRYIPGRGHQTCPGPPDGKDCAHFRLTLMRQEIADYLGLTIETVSRLLTNLRRRGVVQMDGPEEIVVDDVCRLCRLTGTHLNLGEWCSAHIDEASYGRSGRL